jgi:diguanylate cyclase (GGDEF)-like protein
MKISSMEIELAAPKSDVPRTLQPVIFAVIVGVIGAALNCYPIELAYNISLVLGNFAFILVAAYCRPRLALLSALICATPLMFMWGHPYGFLTFGCEALFVATMRSRGWYLPTADFLYWLIIGMPLTALLIILNNDAANDYLLFSIFKQSINAVFYTAIAVIIIFILADKLKAVKAQQPSLVKNLNQYLHHILWVMSAFFVIGVCLFLSRNLNDNQHHQIEDKLAVSSQYLGNIVNNHITEHEKAIQQLANQLSGINDNTQYRNAVVKTHALYPGFLTMLSTDKRADLIATSPKSLMENVNVTALNVADRPYFIHAMKNKRLYISSVFLGRGFGADPIVAISAPVFTPNDSEQPIGIIEGSLDLSMFSSVSEAMASARQVKVVLTDSNENVIYAHSALKLEVLSKFNYNFDPNGSHHQLLTLNSNGNINYLYHQVELENGWKIFSLVEQKSILQIIEQQYLTIFSSLFLIFALVIVLANQFAKSLNQPLQFAIDELANGDNNADYKPIPYDAPIEFISLYDQLQEGKQRLLKHQFILEEKVSKRTKALNKANQALKSLANTDSLTGLYNRRYLEKRFDELQSILSRNDASMVLAMLDLDHFKQLNDVHGHLLGDKCLVYVASLMKSMFDRSSDIVARFGGEEFIIIVQNDKDNAALATLEKLRIEIEQHRFALEPNGDVGITISIGAVIAKAQYSMKIEQWIGHADERLYWVKENSRNQLSVKTLT